MGRLAIKLSAFILLVSLANVLLLMLLAPDENAFLRAVIDKEERLRATTGPKLIIVGGSSACFGVDSRKIDAAFPTHSVVNMGLQGSIGLRYLLAQVVPYVGSGDVVAMNLEYDQFFGDANGGEALLTVWQVHPKGRQYIENVAQYYNMARNVADVLSKRLEGKTRTAFGPGNDVYRRDGFNQYGDLISQLGQQGTDQIRQPLFPDRHLAELLDREAVGIVNAFAATCRDRGAHVALAYAAIPLHHAKNRRDSLKDLDERLRASIEVDVLCSPMEAAQPNDAFFDSVYHLNSHGRDVRTSRLIHWLSAMSLGRGYQTPVTND